MSSTARRVPAMSQVPYTVSRRAKDLLGWSAELTQADGIRDAIAWLPERKKILGY